MDKHVSSKMDVCRNELTKLKGDLQRESYKWVEELRQLNLEIGNLEQQMITRRQEAMNEEDPVRRAKILQLIEEDGKVLKEKYQKKQELSNKFNFDPSKKVNDLIEKMKKAI